MNDLNQCSNLMCVCVFLFCVSDCGDFQCLQRRSSWGWWVVSFNYYIFDHPLSSLFIDLFQFGFILSHFSCIPTFFLTITFYHLHHKTSPLGLHQNMLIIILNGHDLLHLNPRLLGLNEGGFSLARLGNLLSLSPFLLILIVSFISSYQITTKTKVN